MQYNYKTKHCKVKTIHKNKDMVFDVGCGSGLSNPHSGFVDVRADTKQRLKTPQTLQVMLLW
jgi:hypothetical protein